MQQIKGEFLLTDDRSKMQVEEIQAYLSRSYWAENIPIKTVKKSIAHSHCFGIFHHERQIAFARVITDYATYGYLADVYVLEEYRKRGLSKWMMQCIMEHPQLQGFRKWMLGTRDAHGLYAKFGFAPVKNPERIMHIRVEGIYRKTQP